MLNTHFQKLLQEASTFSRLTTISNLACRLSSFRVEDDGISPPRFPRITIPHALTRRYELAKQKKMDSKEDKMRQKRKHPKKEKGQIIISCNRKVYNFYEGQKFDAYNVATMVSCGWKNKKRVGDAFTLMPHGLNPSLQDNEEQPVSFNELGISQDICLGLNDLQLDVPTEIQRLTIPSLMRGDNVVCAAETGSGKTLAYLLPSIEWLYKKRALLKRHDQEYNNLNMPNTVVLTPSRELSTQVMNVAKSLQPYADFTPYCILGGELICDDSGKKKKVPMDILITSPGKLLKLLKKSVIKVKHLQHLVIDEADTLLDDSFIKETRDICQKLQVMAGEQLPSDAPEDSDLMAAQLVLVSATMPQHVDALVDTLVPIENLEKITTKGLHQIMPHVQQKFIRINPDGKPDLLVKLLNRDNEQKATTLVFTKNTHTCHYVHNMLNETGINCLKLHSGMEKDERTGVWEKFTEGYSDVLIATDIASRGLDSVHVTHVINFDCPGFMADYIHRVGRVGRVGQSSRAKVTTLVAHKWDVDLIWRIEVCARKMKPLSDVNANISQELDALKKQKNIPLSNLMLRRMQ